MIDYSATSVLIRLFHQCLSEQHSKMLSMSAQRELVVQQLQTEIDHFCDDNTSLLLGYERFLQLAADTEDTTIIDYRNELAVFNDQLNRLRVATKQLAANITSALHHKTEILNTNGYAGWLAQCKTLKATLQNLNQPADASAISSLHDFIFLLHKRFVSILPSIAQFSGQGRAIGFGQNRISGKWVDFIPPGQYGLTSADIGDALKTFDGKVTVVNLPTAFRLNARLGNHVCEVAMLKRQKAEKVAK